jgi:hypothetical protein
MNKLATTILILGFFSMHFFAQNTSGKLSGTIIGTTNYYDYSTNTCSTSSGLSNYAFDGNLSNSFATCDVSGGWIGYDLGEPYIITKITYCPRTGQAARMLLGVFEGANKPDFGDAMPLFLIAQTPAQNILTPQTINCSKGFRYIRYVGPTNAKCNVAEIEFYGYKGIGDNSNLIQTTNLPTVVIHTTNAQDIVEKEVYIKGIVSVISDNGTKITTDSLDIKGRGNVSWGFPKKPYRLKLYHKVSLLGLPAVEKSWTLINNYGDKTLMRNLLAFDLSKQLDIPYTSAGKAVDVFLNGEYKGTYQLCDQIEVATGRVEVDNMKTTTVTLPDLSGGYLIEMDAYANEEISWFTSARNMIPVTIKYPKDDEIVPAQSAYIKAQFEIMETALYASNYLDPTNGYKKYIDIETFIRHFLVGEISGNTDTYWSTYMYKKKNDDKFYFGPVWDFDIAYENDYRTYPINNNPNWIFATSGSSANGVRDLVNRLFTDPIFQSRLKAIYASYRSSGKINTNAMLQVADNYAAQIDQSQKLNFTRWDLLNTKVHMNPQALGSYSAEVLNVKNYIKNRIVWMDNKLGYSPLTGINDIESTVYLWNDRNVIHIEGLSENSDIRIADMSGRIILTEKANTHFTTSLKPGVYLVYVSDKINGNRVLRSIIQ